MIAAVLQLITVSDDADMPRTNDVSGQQWEIENTTIIGRSNDAGVALSLSAVSRRHAELTVADGHCQLADLSSTNGTTVNGTPLVPGHAHTLHDGDEIVIAGVAALRFVDPMATPVAPRIGKLTGVWIDPATDAVWVDARRIEPPLSQRQHALLQQLVDAEGEIVARTEIIAHVWADVAAAGVSDDAVNAVIKRLRQRLRDTSSGAELIDIVRGRGLRLR